MSDRIPLEEAVVLHELNKPGGRFWLEPFDGIRIDDGPVALVKDVIFPQSLVIAYGESSCGKTFLMCHLALHVAAGRAWGGKSVIAGPVIYVAAEGARGFRTRLAAARRFMDLPVGLPFYLVADAPDLGHGEGDAPELIGRIKAQVDGPITLLVIDTMSRVMAGADENMVSDTMTFVRNCSRLMEALGCTVVVVHHSGKDSSRGARGSSALRAAADTEILVEKSETGRLARITKQKDGEEGLTLTFELERAALDGEGQSSCVVHIGQWQFSNQEPTVRLTRQTRIALDALRQAITSRGEPPPSHSQLSSTIRGVPKCVWQGACEDVSLTDGTSRDTKRKAFFRSKEKLENLGIVGRFEDYVWIAK